MRWFRVCALLAITGCATAGKDKFGNTGHDANPGRDGQVTIDAPAQRDAAVDAVAGVVTLSETADNTVAAGKSLACGNADGTTADNIWYRAYKMSDFGVTNTLQVTSVTFGIQESAGSPSVTVKIGSYSGTVGGTTINSAQIGSLGQATVTIPATTTGELVTAPITASVPAGNFVVQIVAPNLNATTKYIYLGATSGIETQPGYISSAACSFTTPETMQTAAQSCSPTPCTVGQIIINVAGTH